MYPVLPSIVPETGSWGARIRTAISRVRVCCPTVGRRPNELHFLLLNLGQGIERVSNPHLCRHGAVLYQFEPSTTWAPLTECHSLVLFPRTEERNFGT